MAQAGDPWRKHKVDDNNDYSQDNIFPCSIFKARIRFEYPFHLDKEVDHLGYGFRHKECQEPAQAIGFGRTVIEDKEAERLRYM